MARAANPGALLRRARQSRFARNVALLAFGTAGGQAITMVFAPLITRIYGPEAFGLLGTFTALVAVVTPLAALAYPIAIVLPKGDHEALGIARLSLALSAGVAVLAWLLLWLGGGWLTRTLNAGAVAAFLFLIPVIMFFSGCQQVVHQWLIRKKQFSVIARVAVLQSLLLNVAKAAVGWFIPTGAVLIVVSAAGVFLHAAMMAMGARARSTVVNPERAGDEAASPGTLAFRYRDFPLYRVPQNFINAASQSLPVLMLAAFFGPAAAGFYALSKTVMGVPAVLVGKAVSDVFYPRITEAAHDGEDLYRQLVRGTAALFAIGLVPFGVVMATGPWLFAIVFGEQWVVAGEYARWLALFFLFNFINKPAVAAVPVLGIQRGLLIYELFSTGAKVLGFLAGLYWFASDRWAVALFSVLGVLAYSAMIVWILLHAKRWRGDAEAGQ